MDPILELTQRLISDLEAPLLARDNALSRGDNQLAALIQGEIDIVARDLRAALTSPLFVYQTERTMP
jgi:hypothetical protein